MPPKPRLSHTAFNLRPTLERRSPATTRTNEMSEEARMPAKLALAEPLLPFAAVNGDGAW